MRIQIAAVTIGKMRLLPTLILGIILILGLFFRTYKIIDRFEFAHDGDLYSWIIKDILVNGHLRLIGQQTTAPGIFIGPAYYYLITPFFILSNMDPIGVLIPITLLGLFTIFSYYFVLANLFKKEIGFIAAFLYAVLTVTVNADRWVVPTVTTSLWSIWYFYTLILLSRGNFSALWLVGILIGLIWHIHIALIPTLIAIPIAILISKRIPSLKQTLFFTASLLITSAPLIIFELRHNFGQSFSLINNFTNSRESFASFYKFQLVLEMITKNVNSLLFSPQSFKVTNNIFFVLLIFLSALLPIKKKLISPKELIPQYFWALGVIIFFTLSSSTISEYYFANITVIFIVIVSFLLYLLFKFSFWGKLITLVILAFILIKNTFFLITQDFYHKGYVEKKSVVEYIKKNSKELGYPCVGINYITNPGENVGFRYLFYLKNVYLTHPSLNVPVYNIVIPEELSKEVKVKFGHIGLILPSQIPPKDTIEKGCQTPNTNLEDPMPLYVE
ncbi:glycosyltransferase family 39 protein [Candidatus Daviesbacteria bacterium]|nr:glycosyltransferase family 39 protein [Candidatus Daviesbacteria bacterium]